MFIFANCACTFDALALTKMDLSKTLSLELQLDNENTTTTKVALTVSLINTTDQTLTYTISTNLPPLAINLWDKKGFNLTLKQRTNIDKGHSNRGKELIIKPYENLVFNPTIDLNNYRDDIAGETTVIIEASFILFKMTSETIQYASIKAPAVEFDLPDEYRNLKRVVKSKYVQYHPVLYNPNRKSDTQERYVVDSNEMTEEHRLNMIFVLRYYSKDFINDGQTLLIKRTLWEAKARMAHLTQCANDDEWLKEKRQELLK